jgi:GT2 family glycosyltransferase
MKSFYNCNFFEKQFEVEDKFSVRQQQLVLKTRHSDGKTTFKKLDVVYDCQWKEQSDWSSSKPTLIIPTKDQQDLVSFTISNLKQNNIDVHCNIIIIDDRSTEDIEKLASDAGFSYLRVDNEIGFNFSMLNNIAMKICESMGIETAILWNSDLWIAKEEYFVELLKRHKHSKSVASGSKLLYPPEEMSLGEIDSENIKENFPHMVGGKWRKTIQFGGDAWFNTPSDLIKVTPIHYKRFAHHEDNRVNCDRGSSFVTGALQIWQVNDFIKLGGLNPSLAKNFQDTDICLKLVSNGSSLMYFGKDIFFYHDESPTLNKEGKKDKQLMSDYILFGKIWNDSLPTMVF